MLIFLYPITSFSHKVGLRSDFMGFNNLRGNKITRLSYYTLGFASGILLGVSVDLLVDQFSGRTQEAQERHRKISEHMRSIEEGCRLN